MKKPRNVAISIAVFVIIYWLVSALIYDLLAYIEGDEWGVPISIYYAAISFTTVGLGDYSLRWYGEVAYLEVFQSHAAHCSLTPRKAGEAE